MDTAHQGISEKSIAILERIAAGHTYEQSLDPYPAFTYRDIFNAAEQALGLIDNRKKAGSGSFAEIRKRYPRAYMPWSQEEEQKLRQMHRAGHTLQQIATELQRQPGAIRSRITRLNLSE